MYSVKEVFYTVQGEGARTGRPSVFCRFAGCNLWSGLERDRSKAVCNFCDTDFVGVDGEGGGKFEHAEALAEHAASFWPSDETLHMDAAPYVVCTGGEPLLQLDKSLVTAFHKAGFEVAVETNGTLAAPDGIDWICVSPKADAELVLSSGHELKLVYPQDQTQAQPEQFEELGFDNFFLQPMDGTLKDENTEATIRYCLAHPLWKLSIQTHKIIGFK